MLNFAALFGLSARYLCTRYYNYMKRILLISLLCLLAIVGYCNQTTQGTQFYVTFVNNRNTNLGLTDDPELSLTLHIIGTNSATVTVSNPQTGWSTSASVLQGGTTKIVIPAQQGYAAKAGKDNKGLYISATSPISVYASNSAGTSLDATLLLPVGGLGTDYMAQTAVSQESYPAFVTAVATADNTDLTITPSVKTSLGQPAGTPEHIILNRGETYTILTSGNNKDLSGSRLQSDKPIAVFQGNTYAYVPNENYPSSNHLYEQAFPTHAWGSHFVFTSAVGQVRTRFLVTALTNNTIIMMNGEVWETLNAGETDFYIVYESQDASFIDATGPICCYQYLPSRENNDPEYGNPSMVWVTPIEQLTTHTMFSTLDNGATKHFLNLIVATEDIGKITNNGQVLSLPFTPVPYLDSYSYARISVPANRIFDLQAEHGIMGTCYGIGSETSYAFNIGSAADIVNDGENVITNYEVSTSAVTCDNEPYIFNGKPLTATGVYTETFIARNGRDSIVTLDLTVHPAAYTTLDVTLCDGETYKWQNEVFSEQGSYQRVLRTVNDCDSIITINVTQLPRYVFDEQDEICEGEQLVWHGQTLTASGDYTAWYKTLHDGCDSIYNLHLTVHSRYEKSVTQEICRHGDEPYVWNSEEFLESGTYKRTLNSVHGCDSIVTLHLRFIEPVHTYIADTIVSGESLTWEGSTYTTSGNYEHVYERGNGCDSIATLALVVNNLQTSQQPQIETTCADAGAHELNLNITDGWYDEIRLTYADTLRVFGFTNDTLRFTTTAASLVSIGLPKNAIAGIYTTQLTLLFHGKTVLSRPITFTLLYPSSVIEQAWNDVLAVLTHDYNGGYDFVSFQWYKNGVAIPGATHSYISEPLQDGDLYSCLLTDSRGVQLMTCEMESSSKSKIRISPTIARPNEHITIEMPEAGEVSVFDVNGQHILSATLDEGLNRIAAPNNNGIYLISVTSDNKTKNTSQKIIVTY